MCHYNLDSLQTFGLSFPFWLSPIVSMFYSDAPCFFLLQVKKVFCYSVGAEALYVCFPMLTVFSYVTMKSAFRDVFFLLLIIYLNYLLLSLKRSSLNCVSLSFAQVLDAVVCLVVSYIVQFYHHFNSCLVS